MLGMTVCYSSAIELVDEVAASDDHQCSTVAKCALERLFGANLPAKYWVTGSLDMTDSTVNTEFYDAGPVSSKLHTTSPCKTMLVCSWYGRHIAASLLYPCQSCSSYHSARISLSLQSICLPSLAKLLAPPPMCPLPPLAMSRMV